MSPESEATPLLDVTGVQVDPGHGSAVLYESGRTIEADQHHILRVYSSGLQPVAVYDHGRWASARQVRAKTAETLAAEARQASAPGFFSAADPRVPVSRRRLVAAQLRSDAATAEAQAARRELVAAEEEFIRSRVEERTRQTD